MTMTLTQFKREIQVGDFLTMLSHSWFPHGHLIGQRRPVVAVRSNDLQLQTVKPDYTLTNSTLSFPKASGFKFIKMEHEPDRVEFSSEGDLIMLYSWERKGEVK